MSAKGNDNGIANSGDGVVQGMSGGAAALAVTAHGNVVRFLPTLSMSEKHLEEAVEMMGDALDGLYGAEEE
jgi:acetylornithine/succinyldiaminopimelate/putrescine aminotransferase